MSLTEGASTGDPAIASAGSDARALLLRLPKQAPAIELGSVDILFLAALHLRTERAGLSSFSESELLDTFREIVALSDPNADNVRKRATHALSRLREQRLLVRVDGSGIVRAGEYAMTRLGLSIVQFFIQDEALTQESLSLLTHSLGGTLDDLVRAAQRARNADELRGALLGPLRVTVPDLAEGIARRQRALDLQQEDFQREVATLLRADWFGALEHCQNLLDATSKTLRELNEILLRDSHRVHEGLQQLRDLAREASCDESENAVERVAEQVDRIAQWGAARQRAWSEYHQYVHRFLRDVVRLDPTRALTERLRNQLAGKSGRPFALAVAAEPSIVLLREQSFELKRQVVRRPRREREAVPESEPAVNADLELERLVECALAAGASGLAEVTERVAAALPEGQRYVSAGRIAALVARLGRATPEHERPWLPIANTFLVEEWSLEPPRGEE